MPIFFQSSTTNMPTFKIALISSTVLSAAVMLTVTDFAGSVPSIYNAVVSWLRPPYLYLLLNCIIITIVASSKLHPNKDDAAPLDAVGIAPPQPVEYKYDDGVVLKDSSRYQVNVEKGVEEDTTGKEDLAVVVDESNKENEYVVAKSAFRRDEFKEFSPSGVKPPVSARFGHRKNAKASPEGSGGRAVLGVSKAKKQETLESTWKTITEGRPIPISRHLKKSETWERDANVRDQPQKTMQKSETFNNRSSVSRKLRKEPSLSQDELNRRVEAFIKKFNEDMRLQRQDSLNQYKEMVSRGAH